MHQSKLLGFCLLAAGVSLVTVAVLLLLPATAQAQCGGGTSSCQTCHEANGEFSVVKLGEWHSDHVPGFYCANCHQGENAASDKDVAHAGMVDPLANPVATCQSCHKSDTEDFAQRYQALLTASGAGNNAAPVPISNPVDPLDAPTDPLDAPTDPLDAPTDPLDAPTDPLDAPADPLDAPSIQTPPAAVVTVADEPEQEGNRILVVLAEGLFLGGIGMVWFFERR